jgi:replicative superfamily II helicase
MLVTEEALLQVDSHWAVAAIGDAERDRGIEVAKAKLVRQATGHQLSLSFTDRATDESLIERLSLAYEIAASEGLDALLNPSSATTNKELQSQAQAGAWRAFEFRRLVKVPTVPEERIFHILHLASLAYCGDRWSDLRRWIQEHEEETTAPSVADALWDKRVLYRLFDCWVRLFRKDGWDDIDQVHEIIAGLRSDQDEYEKQLLVSENSFEGRVVAMRLVALYHLAKSTEILATYVLQGAPASVNEDIDKHFEAAINAAPGTHDASLEVLLKWLHITSRRMIAGSIWWVAGKVNSRVTKFIKSVTTGSQAMFELLPPQRAALQEQGLLDQAYRAIVVDMPTSGGKTLLAEFRALQALNQFEQDRGWVAYVAPTRALVSQITRRLRRDLEPFGVIVEQLTSAVDIDAFEDEMLASSDAAASFDVLVCTPEKLQMVIRNNKVPNRPLVLAVMDEAHNIEDKERGLRIELLLATIRRECDKANFLLLMPFVPNGNDLAKWLGAQQGKAISIGTSAWKPNERIVGLFYPEQDDSVRAGWRLAFKTLSTTPKTIHLKGTHHVDGVKPLSLPWNRVRDAVTTQAAAMAKVFSERGTSIAIATNTDHAWAMARRIVADVEPFDTVPEQISLVQRFLQTEIGEDFELIDLLERGIAVHHAGLSDEVRSLVEWLAEEQVLRVLCATTTIAQGINFPVSSVFLASYKYPYGQEMSPREFWNLAGRAGRIGQDSIGVVGIARGDNENRIKSYVKEATGELVSQLVSLLDDVQKAGKLNSLSQVIAEEQWRDFRCYVAHLMIENDSVEEVLAETESLLRSTYGYASLRANARQGDSVKADALLKATKGYVQELAKHPENAALADSTGFAPEGVRAALLGLNNLENNLAPADWEPESLFGKIEQSSLPNLIGVMLRVNELNSQLKEISNSGLDQRRMAQLTSDWVNGRHIRDIAKDYFQSESADMTAAITKACKGIYRTLCNSGPWGMSALSKMPTSGLNFETLSEDSKRRINALPSMIYHGVKTETAVLLRMNSVPRSIAEPLGDSFNKATTDKEQNVKSAREFLKNLNDSDWESARPAKSALSGPDYKTVWRHLSGEDV